MGKQKDLALGRTPENPVHNRDIERMDELVFIYINGSAKEKRGAQKDILELMDSYLEKYVNLFAGSQIDLMNYDTRGFLAMFLTGRPKTPINLAQQRSYIANVMSRFSRDDIKNELIVLFLGVLDKYRIYPGVNALNPLTKFFRYRTKDWFNRIVKDALFKTVDVEQFTSDSDSGDKITFDRILDMIDPVLVNYEENLSQFDLNWVRQPPQKIYQSLTTYERYLLFLMFNQDLNLGQIAEKLERDKDTIRRHTSSLLEKLQEKFKDDHGSYE